MNTMYKTEIKDENMIAYLDRLKGRIFKIIPMREQHMVYDKYVEGLIQELLSLDEILEYPIGVEIICNLQTVLTSGECITFKDIKKQIFKTLDIIEKMIKLLEVV